MDKGLCQSRCQETDGVFKRDDCQEFNKESVFKGKVKKTKIKTTQNKKQRKG